MNTLSEDQGAQAYLHACLYGEHTQATEASKPSTYLEPTMASLNSSYLGNEELREVRSKFERGTSEQDLSGNTFVSSTKYKGIRQTDKRGVLTA